MSKASRYCVILTLAAVAALSSGLQQSQGAAKAKKPSPPKEAKEKQYPAYPKVNRLKIGDAAPDFKLPGVDGKTHTLAEYKDAKVLAIVFTCNHCPTSRMQEDAIIKLATDYAKKGVKFVAISPNDPGALRPDEVAGTVLGDSVEEMKTRAAEKKYPFPYLYDGETQKAAMAYGATLTPMMFVFDAERKLRYTGDVEGPPYSTTGGPHTKIAIEAMLAGKKVIYDSTRPFGCSTKWGFKRRSVDYDTALWNEKPVTLADIDLAACKKLKANDSNVLKLICVWSISDKSSVAAMKDLIMLRRIYERHPLELITINVDPPAKKKEALAILKKHNAARPNPTRFAPVDPKTPINYMFTGKKTAELFKALGAKDKPKPAAPYSVMIIPGGEVIHTQTKKMDARVLRAELVKVFRR